ETRYGYAQEWIDLIRKICDALRLSPNDLLGSSGTAANDWIAGFSERQQAWHGPPPQPAGHLRATEQPELARGALCWLIAREFSALESEVPTSGGGLIASELQRSGALFKRLSERPFDAISAISQHPALSGQPSERTARIRQLIDQLAETLYQPGSTQ
ncbi:MAG TPA: hypothetical protein PK264_20455, partial [Hyphomicrobiaceae bacterium]|nr:hypothetical protein [Hyphomicrobiaceae bacterium]